MALKLPSSWKVIAFTFNLMLGLSLSQILGGVLEPRTYNAIAEMIQALTMWALSFIMIGVGYEFTIDKAALKWYAWDYLIAMTAAGFPWLFVALWYLLTLSSMKVDEAFLVARFAAPTSAGILFSMLEAAGLRETWVFQKARILAIFDDLDTIILMIPLKVVMIGFKWELVVVIAIMAGLLWVTWWKLHALHLPHSWQWTLFYAAIVSSLCKVVHYSTHHYMDMEPVHIEVLLPAFVLGCIIDTPCAREELKEQKRQLTRKLSELTEKSLSLSTPRNTAVAVVPSEDTIEVSPVEDFHPKNEHIPWEPQTSEVSTSAETCRADPVIEVVQAPGFVEENIDETDVVGVIDVPLKRDQSKVSHDSDVPIKRDISKLSHGGSSGRVSEISKGSRASSSNLSRHGLSNHGESDWEHTVQTTVSMVFMVLVGLSMPPLVGKSAKESDSAMEGSSIAFHVFMVTVLMILGKMFPAVCYRDEASPLGRLALCLGMCPRGEVGASIIVISLDLGITGPAIIISMCALVINLVMSGGFIGAVKLLLNKDSSKVGF